MIFAMLDELVMNNGSAITGFKLKFSPDKVDTMIIQVTKPSSTVPLLLSPFPVALHAFCYAQRPQGAYRPSTRPLLSRFKLKFSRA